MLRSPIQLALTSAGKSRSSARKSPGKGRPRIDAMPVDTRFPPDELSELDAWIAKQKDLVTRPEAVRRLVALGLKAKGKSKQGREAGLIGRLARAAAHAGCAGNNQVNPGLRGGVSQNIERVGCKSRFTSSCWKATTARPTSLKSCPASPKAADAGAQIRSPRCCSDRRRHHRFQVRGRRQALLFPFKEPLCRTYVGPA